MPRSGPYTLRVCPRHTNRAARAMEFHLAIEEGGKVVSTTPTTIHLELTRPYTEDVCLVCQITAENNPQ